MSRRIYGQYVVKLFTTPRRMREIADALEKTWTERRPGSDLHADTELSEEIAIQFICDQEGCRR